MIRSKEEIEKLSRAKQLTKGLGGLKGIGKHIAHTNLGHLYIMNGLVNQAEMHFKSKSTLMLYLLHSLNFPPFFTQFSSN
ncbi:MAG: hypothetical protein ACTSP3_14940 [Candidatus Heimdallarchaeaceae archaeon]